MVVLKHRNSAVMCMFFHLPSFAFLQRRLHCAHSVALPRDRLMRRLEGLLIHKSRHSGKVGFKVSSNGIEVDSKAIARPELALHGEFVRFGTNCEPADVRRLFARKSDDIADLHTQILRKCAHKLRIASHASGVAFAGREAEACQERGDGISQHLLGSQMHLHHICTSIHVVLCSCKFGC